MKLKQGSTSVPIKITRTLLLALTSVALTAAAPLQASPPARDSLSLQIMPNAIPLRPPAPEALPEQWERDPEAGRLVWNVADPALIPVLPAKGKRTGVAIIVAPGGSFERLYIDTEGFDIARRLAARGISAFVLKYRTKPLPRTAAEIAAMPRTAPVDEPPHPEAKPEAVADAQAAVRYLREHAAQLHIDPTKIGFVGFSAGAMTTLAVGVTADRAARPDFIAPIYGPLWLRPVPLDAPPMFTALALDDPIFGAGEELPLIQAWRDAKRPINVHLYHRGGHGFATNSKAEAPKLWFEEMFAWMKDLGLFGKPVKVTYSTAQSTVGELLDNPRTREIVLRYYPHILEFGMLEKARTLPIGQFSTYVPAQFPPEELPKIDAELAKLR